jgi:hypothetical protein
MITMLKQRMCAGSARPPIHVAAAVPLVQGGAPVPAIPQVCVLSKPSSHDILPEESVLDFSLRQPGLALVGSHHDGLAVHVLGLGRLLVRNGCASLLDALRTSCDPFHCVSLLLRLASCNRLTQGVMIRFHAQNANWHSLHLIFLLRDVDKGRFVLT